MVVHKVKTGKMYPEGTRGIPRPRCPTCGRFVADLITRFNMERITGTTGVCAKHGRVEANTGDWGWEELLGENFDPYEAVERGDAVPVPSDP